MTRSISILSSSIAALLLVASTMSIANAAESGKRKIAIVPKAFTIDPAQAATPDDATEQAANTEPRLPSAEFTIPDQDEAPLQVAESAPDVDPLAPVAKPKRPRILTTPEVADESADAEMVARYTQTGHIICQHFVEGQ